MIKIKIFLLLQEFILPNDVFFSIKKFTSLTSIKARINQDYFFVIKLINSKHMKTTTVNCAIYVHNFYIRIKKKIKKY